MSLRELSIEEIRKVQLEILLDVHRYCEENQLRYFLSYGTLLGAVRHHGYIPWDDDIDIVMPRPDYEAFAAHYNSAQSAYRVLTQDINPDFMYSFAKVCDKKTRVIENARFKADMGINIDIFPLDGFPEELDLARHHKLGDQMLLGQTAENPNRAWYKRVLYSLFKLVFPARKERRIIKKIIKNATSADYETAKRVCQLVTGTRMNKPLDKALFAETCLLDFEGYAFRAPKAYDTYLTSLYGDYMKLPPIEKQVTHHDFTVLEREG